MDFEEWVPESQTQFLLDPDYLGPMVAEEDEDE